MEYTPKKFAAELIIFLEDHEFSLEKLFEWADAKFFSEINNIHNIQLKSLIYEIGCMSTNPELSLTKKELKALSFKILKQSCEKIAI